MVLFAVVAVVATFFLVAGYNTIVNTSHNITAMKAELDQVGADNTNLQNRIIGMTGSEAMIRTAQATGLVEDKNPHYLSTNQPWELASQR